ncbi:pentapeptide repeat-containing protein [Chitinimonas sp. JJ19]|uniref:pentapeptide repeat-containing protein n=1 Tax=Chitinimonas sp. JJ19 TaxID=3109352 RepID=UPI0030019DDD
MQQGLILVSDQRKAYRPPESREELEKRYSAGERHFPETDLSGADLSWIVLDGADFGRWSWFFDANFKGASLRGTCFKECNVKCVDFSNADLTGAVFELAAIESIKATDAKLEGIKVKGATFYGCELAEGDELPSWEW